MSKQNLEFGMYMAVLLIFCAGILTLLIRQPIWWTWLAGLVAGLAWLITWYAPVLIWIGILLELFALGGLFLSVRKPRVSFIQTSEGIADEP
jgi:hypothetical protein